MPSGYVKRLVADKGFGFIEPAGGGADIFFHHSAVAEQGFERLRIGQPVDFELAAPTAQRPGPGPRAAMVRPGSPPPRDKLSMLRRHPRSRAKKPTWRD